MRLNRQLALHIALISVVFVAFNLIGAIVFQRLDNLTFTDGFYLAMSASTTSGYGNVAATSDSAKWFISFYQIVGYGLLFYLYSASITPDLEKEKLWLKR